MKLGSEEDEDPGDVINTRDKMGGRRLLSRATLGTRYRPGHKQRPSLGYLV